MSKLSSSVSPIITKPSSKEYRDGYDQINWKKSHLPKEDKVERFMNILGEWVDPYDGAGWPGDGSGTDDLADYNQNEADDYRNE